MKLKSKELRLSATDLSNHLACSHLTQLDLSVARGERSSPTYRDPAAAVLQLRGLEHEKAYVDHLQARGLKIEDLSSIEGHDDLVQFTQVAIEAGVDVIVQGALTDGKWFGRPDVLLKVAAPSKLGRWSYEVVDTKLSNQTRAGTVLQLSLYSDLLETLQGKLPDDMHVVSPGEPFHRAALRVLDYTAYYRLVKKHLVYTVEKKQAKDKVETYPEPVDHCQVCKWWPECDKRRRDDDHLSLVAGITKLQTREFERISVNTLTELAKQPTPFASAFKRGNKESFVKAREQARIQLEGRISKNPKHELLAIEEGRGLSLLPEPSPGDLFFDIEGDPFVPSSGLEYLFGVISLGANKKPVYQSMWATSLEEERKLFDWFMDLVCSREKTDPHFHIYHYAPYEPSAIKRLMGRHGAREEDVDRLLRAGRFVDLYSVVRQSLRASVERYSIKDLEVFFQFKRSIDLREAAHARHVFEHSLELNRPLDQAIQVRSTIQGYNEDDCLSALALRDWLERLRSNSIAEGHEIQRPAPREGTPSQEIAERDQKIQALKERLCQGVPIDPSERTVEQHGRWLLSELLNWHWREQKVVFWEKFRLLSLSPEELLEDKGGIAGLKFMERVGGTDKCPIHRYGFPTQELDIRYDTLYAGEEKIGSLIDIDSGARTIDIKKNQKSKDVHPQAIFAHDVIQTHTLSDALFRLGEWVAEHGIDAQGPYRAARDLLLRHPPRLAGSGLTVKGPMKEMAKRLALALDNSVLPIQGPPGAGKTTTAAAMICHLVLNGKKVGITAGGHKVIRKLLEDVLATAVKEGLEISCIQKVSEESDHPPASLTETTKGPAIIAALQAGSAHVAAGTQWLWASPDLTGSVDVLFIDEAGQLSLANAVVVAMAAKSVVMLGDPQQLEQPLQGSHPEGTEASALEHLLHAKQTLTEKQGVFLPETWRLHPKICAFTSELFYEGRLKSGAGREVQVISGKSPILGAGLWYLPVIHEGNQNSSIEEAEAVADLVKRLTTGNAKWTGPDGQTAPVTLSDILIVAPYNAQVSLISEKIPGARIGTVDKFQGQEAPIVIYSMTTSSPDEAPRGMEFLYSPNRLNVATSRARCACILVGSPRLFEPECKSPKQMKLANAFCRYLEMAELVDSE